MKPDRMEIASGWSRRPWGRAIAGIVLLAAIAGCAAIREDYPATPSHAFDRPEQSTLGRAFAVAQSRNPGLSGFRLVNNGVSALLTRAALADTAEFSIDMQYYIYDADEAGAFLMERLIAAADRGVRVRVLLDDNDLGLDDTTLSNISAHPNIQIRLFNPFRDRSRWSRPFQLLFQLDRIGRRMHNKLFAVDGQVAVIGGRNISNRYFEAQEESNFRDIDLLAAGPVVRDASKSFDAFWNSPMAIPVEALGAAVSPASQRFDALRRQTKADEGPYAEYGQRKPEFVRRLLAGGDEMIWARGRAISEPPVRQAQDAGKPSSEVARALAMARQGTKREIVYETAYFVPGERGVEVLSGLVARGVRVRMLTNSLAATDVVAVHAGYSRYRAGLLAGGVELHEYRPDAQRPEPQGHRLRPGRSGSALHAKVVIHDRRLVWVGSANFDPRSRRINTEAGLLIESEALAERILSTMEKDFSPQHSWRLELEADAKSGSRNIVWTGEREGRPVRLYHEPDAGIWRQLGVGLFSVLPGIEELL